MTSTSPQSRTDGTEERSEELAREFDVRQREEEELLRQLEYARQNDPDLDGYGSVLLGPVAGLFDQRDRARRIAVTLQQEDAWKADKLSEGIAELRMALDDTAAERIDRALPLLAAALAGPSLSLTDDEDGGRG